MKMKKVFFMEKNWDLQLGEIFNFRNCAEINAQSHFRVQIF